MNNLLSPKLYLLLLLMLGCFGAAVAQDGPPPDGPQKPKRPNLLAALGLSPEQQQAVRRINQQRKPLMEAALARLKVANQAVDEAIYADNLDETAFQAKLRELHAAQAEVARLRFTSELEIRKVLTPDQLARFRDLRRQFQEALQPPDGRPAPMNNRPIRQQIRNAAAQKPLR